MTEVLTLQERVADMLDPTKYSSLAPLRDEDQGLQRQTFIVQFGPGTNKTKRVVKADKLPEGNNAQFLADRNCGTRTELDILGKLDVEAAINHGISPLLDAYIEKDLAISVEPFFGNSTTLRRYVEEHGPLDFKKAKKVFGRVVDGVKFLRNNGIYHRDLSPSNILLRGEKDSLEARITDLANAAPIDRVTEEIMPTAGGRLVRDPLLGTQFTGKPQVYTDQAEIYSLGMTMLYALTGKTPVEYDFLAKKAKSPANGKSLLDDSGLLIPENHNAVVAASIKTLKGRSKTFSSLLERALTVTKENRYGSLEDFVRAFEIATADSLLDDIRRNGHLIGIMGAIGAAGISLTYGVISNRTIESRIELAKAAQYQVYAEFDGTDRSVSNNAVKLDVRAFNGNSNIKPIPSYPQELSFVRARPGESVYVYGAIKSQALPEETAEIIGNTRYDGLVYIESVMPDESTSFHLNDLAQPNVISSDEGYGRGYYGSVSGSISIPHSLKPGTYSIAVEYYAPENEKLPRREIVNFGRGAAQRSLGEKDVPKSK